MRAVRSARMDDGYVVPMIDEELEHGRSPSIRQWLSISVCARLISDYATRVPYQPQLSPADVVESSPPTNSSRVTVKQQRQPSPYPSEQATCFYQSSPPPASQSASAPFSSSSPHPHHRHLPSTSTPSPSPSSPHSPLPSSRPSVIMNKSMPPPHPHHYHHQHHQPQHYHPYAHYDCTTFAQQQYPLTATNDHWYHPPSNIGGNHFPLYHHPPHHSS